MGKWVWLAATAVLCVTTPAMADSAPQAAGHADTALQAAVKAADVKMADRDAKGAESDLKAAVADPQFASASPSVRAHLLTLLGICENINNEPEAAFQHLGDAGTIAPDMRNRYYWVELAYVAYHLHKDEVLGDALTHAVTIAPERANALSADLVFAALGRLRQLKDDNAHRRDLLEALVQAHYDPDANPTAGETVRRSLFELYVDAGEEAKATALIPTLVAPASAIDLRADNRYRKYVDDDAGLTDFPGMVDRYIAALRTRQGSGGLPVAQELALTLAAANRLPQALQVVDNALLLGGLAPGATTSDTGDETKWLLDTRTRILGLMGRWDEVEAAQIKARDAALKEGRDLVSQKINLADLYNRLGRPRDALKELTDLDAGGASVYGKMVAEAVRACAYATLVDKDRLKASLDTLRANADEAPGPLYDALVCTGDEDGAAARIIARLDNPDLRNAQLAAVQDYLPAPHPTAYDQIIAGHEKNIAKRPDVQAAIAKYGVIESYPILQTGD